MLNTPKNPALRSLGLRLATVVTLLAFSAVGSGCFNTYTLTREEFSKLQRPEEIPRVVESTQGVSVSVVRETPIYVRSVGGRRFPVTPFNFKLTQNQLVASDRDLLLMTNELGGYEVDLLSTGKTVGLGSLAAAVAVGLIIFTLSSAGDSGFSE